MTFPTTPLPVVVGIAPGADPGAVESWNFTEITDDVRAADGITIQVGRQDEAGQVDATRTQLVVDNRSGDYSRVNPLGAYYGQLAKGTPLSVAITRIDDAFGRTTSNGWGTDTVSGLSWTHTTSSAWATTGAAATCAFAAANTAATAVVSDACGHDVDITHVSSLSAVATGASWVHATVVRYTDINNYYGLFTEYTTAGTISVKITKTVASVATTLVSLTSTGVSYSANTRIATHVRAIGPTLQIRCWLDGGTEPSTWHAQVDDTDLTGTVPGLLEWRVVGNTNVGTMTCTVDDYRVDVIRAATPVPEWPVRWDKSGNSVTAPIVGAGALRRLSQGQSALRSPIYRQLLRYSPAGYWPLEDGSDATSAASAVAGVKAAILSDVTVGADGPDGAAGAITLNTSLSAIRGTVSSGPSTPDGYAGMIFMKLSALPGSETFLLILNATGTTAMWRITGDATGFRLYGTAADGTATVTPGAVTIYTIDPTRWFAIQLEVEESGGTVNWALIWHQVGDTTFYSTTGSYAGTAEKLTIFTATGTANTSYSHAWLGDNDLPFNDSTFMQVAAGYAGETAGDRIVRLCAEEGVPLMLIGDADESAQMGVQRPATFLALARECEEADQGVLHERAAGLGYLTRAARYNNTATLELDFDSGHIAEPPEPTDDDQRLRNVIVLTRTGGSTVTAQDVASIALNGVYLDEPTVNLQTDGQLEDHAGWRLHLGTVDGLRWPRIQLNLARNPSLIPSWCRVRIGSRITIANPPAAVGVADLDLIVEGWTERLSTYGWDVDLVCSPASPWDVGVYSTSRYDSATTTTTDTLPTGSVGQSGVSLAISTTRRLQVWSTSAVPCVWDLAGEWVTVTAMTAASGSGPYTQTATITRGANGIVKAHAVGEQVRLATPARYAL